MADSSGSSTPVSSTDTLSVPSSPVLQKPPRHLVQQDVFGNPRIQASNIIEFIASHLASTLFVYDLAEQLGFGNLSRSWMGASDAATVISLQTRAGAGLSIVGRLSEGTSRETVKGAVLSAFTTPCGLSVMAQSLSILPPASHTSRLVIQVPTAITVGEAFALSPSLAPLATTLSILPKHITVLLSATPQESVDLASLSYKFTKSHVIHLFDHYSCSRETGHAIKAPGQSQDSCLELSALDTLSKAGYTPFDYVGDAQAQTVLVILNGPLALAAKLIAASTPGFGVVVVRMLRPWVESAFLQILPSSVRHVHVFNDVPNAATQGNLYVDVLGTLLESAVAGPAVHSHRIVPGQTQEYLSKPASFSHFISNVISDTDSISLDSPANAKLLFFSAAHSPLSALPHIIQETFLRNHATSTRLLTDHDICSKSDKITVDRMLLSQTSKDYLPIPIVFPLDHSSQGESDFLGVFDHTLLKSHSVLKYAKPGSGVLVVTPWSATEFTTSVPPDTLSLILGRGLRVYLIDAKGIAMKLVSGATPAHDAMYTLIVHLVFLRLYLGEKANESLVHQAARYMFEDVIQGIPLTKINACAWMELVELEIPAEEILPVSANAPLKEYEFNAIVPDFGEGDSSANGARLGSWHDAARHILFPSVFTPPAPVSLDKYPQNAALRPEITDRTYLVTCTVNRRLTPLEYDRNVFHLEFDTSGTGLTYAIGEALGVHGWNDEREVLDFCAWYGVDPERLVTIPIAGTGGGRMYTRTVLQALQQQVDLFGRPPKSFYTDLSAYATSPVEKLALQFIGSPEGNATFKKLSEKDTVTFADVLGLYPSARPGIEHLCEMVGDIKPRHYSIASAQAAVGDRVDLLVVTVEWLTPNGTLRYGQCTRYLNSLKVGQKVTVSIKPSVMKLPPSHLQPIIMAGLGTGAAPFRAFLQHRAWIAQQGIPVGPMFYYFGSRHQSQEYLYGEEIEAYILDRTITKAGLAFSRDGEKKVYIQHKMLEDAEMLAGMLRDEAGVFYLCGPTWPVPDIYETLVGAFVKYKGQNAASAGEYLESLKEEERYVLEVY